MIDATPALRAYAARRGATLDRQDAVQAQAGVLARLLKVAKETKLGQAYRFAEIRSVRAYQSRVPLTDYERMWPDWLAQEFPHTGGATWPGRAHRFALSSGTSTGRTKYIPVTRAMMRANSRAALDVLTHHLRRNPHSRILSGQSLVLGGSTALRRLAPGIFAGDLSGLAAAAAPLWARPYAFPPREVALLGDWDRKFEAIIKLLPGRRITSLSGTPSWLLLLLDRLGDTAPKTFPALDLLVHGGVPMAPYRARFTEWLVGSRADTREVYPASEGFFAVADQGPDDGMRLIADTGVFYEFIPVAELDAPNPTRHWLRTAEPGTDYALAVTTCAGLWSYLVGDIVRFDTLAPPRLRVTGRTSETLSQFGEHVAGAEIAAAILSAAHETASDLREAATASELHGTHGRHVVIWEGAPSPATAAAIDRALQRANEDYEAHRQGGQMLPPRIVAVPPGTFANWMRAEGRLGGQNKVPRVLSPERLARLLDFVAANPDIEATQNGA